MCSGPPASLSLKVPSLESRGVNHIYGELGDAERYAYGGLGAMHESVYAGVGGVEWRATAGLGDMSKCALGQLKPGLLRVTHRRRRSQLAWRSRVVFR